MKKQQGDVIIRSIKEIPAYAKRVVRQRRGFILAEGEATGHAHVIEEEIEMYEMNGILYLKADRPVTVKHEEHKPVSLDKGVYEIGIVREYDPFEEEVRKVAD
ncbi:MAG: hypothetical protein HZB31_04370 [Nitrospirae bacterium]|nr:hypothetical protein [Nitrospirota bacterium]